MYTTATSPVRNAPPTKSTRLDEDDYDLLYCDLVQRNGRLTKKVPLPALVEVLGEIWEDSGLYDEPEGSGD